MNKTIKQIKRYIKEKKGIQFELDDDDREAINSIVFEKLEDFSIGDALWFDIRYNVPISARKQELSQLEYTVEKKGNSEVVFFVEKDNTRADHMIWVRKIISVLDNYCFIYCNEHACEDDEKETQYEIEKLEGSWKKSIMSIKGLSQNQRDSLLFSLKRHYLEYEMIKEIIDKIQPHTFVCMSDVHPTSSLLTQYCNKKGIRTVTCTHGSFTEKMYYNGYSQYMILYGPVMFKEAIKYTTQKHEKFVVLGNPRFINCNLPEKLQYKGFDSMGIVFDAGFLENINNVRMIKIIGSYAQKFGKSIICKAHPADKGKILSKDYKKLINKLYFDEIGMDDFSKMVDIAFFATSTSYTEFVAKLIPCFRLKTDYDNYEGIDWCIFSTYEELENLLAMYMKNVLLLEDKMKNTREQLSCSGDIATRYKNFIEQN